MNIIFIIATLRDTDYTKIYKFKIDGKLLGNNQTGSSNGEITVTKEPYFGGTEISITKIHNKNPFVFFCRTNNKIMKSYKSKII